MSDTYFLAKVGTLVVLASLFWMPCYAAIGVDCTSDENCTYTGGICVNMTCSCSDTYYINGAQCIAKKVLGTTCGSTIECSDPNAECNTTCQCKSTYYTSGSTCLAKKVLGTTCGSTIECSDPNAECNTTCQCKSTYYTSGSTCLAKKVLGTTCGSTIECSDPNAECNTTCQCKSTYYTSGSTCLAKKVLGTTCGSTIECSDPNAECNSMCQCKSTYYTSGSTCLAKKVLGTTCGSTIECSDPNAECNTMCQCKSTYYTSGSTCLAKKVLGTTCGSTIECSDPNAECNTMCQCKSTYYTSGSTCLAKKVLGTTCGSTIECSDPNAECNTMCQCKSTYYTSGSTCLAKKVLGTTCGSTIECSDPNAECNTMCQCKSTYYTSGSTCLAKKVLGTTCGSTIECSDPNAECNTTCQCKSTYYTSGSTCLAKKVLGTTCGSTIECSDPNAECNTMCQCKSTYYTSGSTCLAKKVLGTTCGSTIECSDPNAECNTMCQCKSTYYTSGSTCLAKKVLGTTCGSTIECSDPNAECNTMCQCKSTYYTSGSTCLAKKVLGTTCGSTIECSDPNAECNTMCQCKSTYYTSGSTCLAKKVLGTTCGSTIECSDPNAECNTMCQCKSTYYTSGSTCLAKKVLGTTCGSTIECSDPNAECNTMCQCKSTYYTSGSTCLAKKVLGTTCGSTIECSDPNAECNTMCQCKSTYYTSGSTCLAKKVLGTTCGSTIECSDPNAECNTTCQCKSTYYTSGSTCLAKLDLGVTCTQNVQCKDSNAVCQTVSGNMMCSCNTGYYDNNFDAAGGTCMAKLQSGIPCMKSGETIECVPNAMCVTDSTLGLICTCVTGYYDDNFGTSGGQCAKELMPGVTCTQSTKPTECVPNAECQNSGSGLKCTCNNDYYANGGYCVAKIAVDAICVHGGPNNTCKDPMSTCTAVNGVYKCTCNSGYYNNEGTCTIQTVIGTACTTSDQCMDPNSSCKLADIGRKCLCNNGYYDYNGTCTMQIMLEDVCIVGRLDNQCFDQNAACINSSGTYRCLCKTDYYKNNTAICTKKPILNEICINGQPNDQCKDNQATCTVDGASYKCLCKAGYYANSAAVCTQKVTLNAACISGQPSNQCSDTNAECKMDSASNYKCLCKNDFYSNSTSVCARKSILGESCINGQPANQCSVNNTECIPDTVGGSMYKCICMSGYYRDNQTCKPLTELQVLSLTVPDNTTGETYFLVKWTSPTAVNFTSKYQLILSAVGQSEETPVNINKTLSSYNVTARTPGRRYIITLRTVETLTRPSEQTTNVSVIDGCRPAVPGAIVQSTFIGPAISVNWTITGEVDYFSGWINDSTASPTSFNLTAVNRLPPPLNVTNLRHGERYEFTVISYSNGFSSDPKTQAIRTTPMTPSPPMDLTCVDRDIFDTSMTLTWNKPTLPNGDILYYIIYTGGQQIQTNGSVTKQMIEGLSPETSYQFSIVTVNDALNGMSVQSGIQCRTKTALASRPRSSGKLTKTSDSLTVYWDSPAYPGGVLYGYRLTIRNATRDNEFCVKEIILQCTSGCVGVTNINSSCTNTLIVNTNIVDMNRTMNYMVDGLSPYVYYKVRIQAVNFRGDGNYADVDEVTMETIPQKPTQVSGVARSPHSIEVSWIQPLPRPGITTYTVKVYEENDVTKEFVIKDGFNKVITGFFNQTALIDGLDEFWQYQFVIEAKTSIGSVNSDTTTSVRTNSAEPGKVENFNVKRPSGIYTQIEVMWNIPSVRNRNGEISYYNLSNNISGSTVSQTVFATGDSMYKTFNVTPEQYYHLEVVAVNSANQTGNKDKAIFDYYAEPGPPITPVISALADEKIPPTTTQNAIKLKFVLDWFLNTKNGKRTDGGVMVCPGSDCNAYGANSTTKRSMTLATWKQSKLSGFTKAYRVTNETWVDDHNVAVVRRKRSTSVVPLEIGGDTHCDKMNDTTPCNGPLPAGTSFIVVTFVCTNGGCTESPHYGPFFTLSVIVEPFPIAIVAGVVGGGVALIIIIIIIILMNRRGHGHKPMDDADPDFECPTPLETPSVERKNIKRKRPVMMSMFDEHVEKLHKDSNLKFAHEYEEVKVLTDPKTLKEASTAMAETEQNKLKNRYVNILPYDKTIVKLLPLEDDDENGSTFINANYIPGYSSKREYIASQGPIPSTIDDFWRMIWEQNVSIIVMLTLCKEEGRIKCECYWPTESSEPKQYGDIGVEMGSCSTINTYEMRVFKLTLGNKTRNVKHFHFLNWKDFSANVQNDVMIDFIQNVRSHVTIPESKVPMVVHCSAGVGRTGTFIALDHLMQFIRDHDFSHTIDIFDLVVTMRECRMYMVQTEQQYIFIHDCIKDILERKRQKELANQDGGDDLYGNSNVQENIYENKAFEAEPELYQNFNRNQSPKTDL